MKPIPGKKYFCTCGCNKTYIYCYYNSEVGMHQFQTDGKLKEINNFLEMELDSLVEEEIAKSPLFKVLNEP